MYIYNITHKGMTLESFNAKTDKEAVVHAMSRYTHFDLLTNATSNINITHFKNGRMEPCSD